MSHVKFDSDVKQNPAQVKIVDAKVEKFSDAVTLILRTEATAKMKKLVYVFISVRQLTPTAFSYIVDDSRDKISANAQASIKMKFEEIFNTPVNKVTTVTILTIPRFLSSINLIPDCASYSR